MKCNATTAIVGKIMKYETYGIPKYWSGFATGTCVSLQYIHKETKSCVATRQFQEKFPECQYIKTL